MQLHCKDWNLCVLSRYIAMSCWEISDPGIHVAVTACTPGLNVVLDQAHTTMLKFQYLVSPFCLVVLVLTNTLNTYANPGSKLDVSKQTGQSDTFYFNKYL